jgi:hypothetical protein
VPNTVADLDVEAVGGTAERILVDEQGVEGPFVGSIVDVNAG